MAAKRAVAKEAAKIAMKHAGEEISEASARRIAKDAEKAITKRLRDEARGIANATDKEVVHHANTLVGHPPFPGRGPVRSHFPTMGFRWIANSGSNLVKILKNDPGRHILLHQRAYIAEKIVIMAASPVLTGVRILANIERESNLDITVEQECKKGGDK